MKVVAELDQAVVTYEDFETFLNSPSCPVEYYGFEDGSAGTEVLPNFLVLVGFWGLWMFIAWIVMANIRHSQR